MPRLPITGGYIDTEAGTATLAFTPAAAPPPPPPPEPEPVPEPEAPSIDGLPAWTSDDDVTTVDVTDGLFEARPGAYEKVVYILPDNFSGRLRIIGSGGQQVAVVGERAAMNPLKWSMAPTDQRATIAGFNLASMHVVGLDIWNTTDQEFDGVVAGNVDYVFLRSCRILDMEGTHTSYHGDNFQVQGNIGQLFIENCYIRAGYQGVWGNDPQNTLDRLVIEDSKFEFNPRVPAGYLIAVRSDTEVVTKGENVIVTNRHDLGRLLHNVASTGFRVRQTIPQRLRERWERGEA